MSRGIERSLRGARLGETSGAQGRAVGNGPATLIFPGSRGAGRRGRELTVERAGGKVRRDVEGAGRELRPRGGGSERSSRCGRAKGRFETTVQPETVPGSLRSFDPGRLRPAAGSEAGDQRQVFGSMFGPRMPAGERVGKWVTWNHFFF
jgi:hypothetical protein